MCGYVRILLIFQILSSSHAKSKTSVEEYEQNNAKIVRKKYVLSVSEKPEVTLVRNASSHFGNSIMDEESHFADITTRICYLFPGICSKLESMKQRFFSTGIHEARGPKDLIAIISTMLAAILGAILVKLKVLIVLSLISVGIGKLLLLILLLKSQIFGHKISPQPTVYEKIYYPPHLHHSHKEYISQLPQSYNEDYQTYSLSK